MTGWLDRSPRTGSILTLMFYAAAIAMLVLIPLWMWWRGTL